jgi:hypothetical protein
MTNILTPTTHNKGTGMLNITKGFRYTIFVVIASFIPIKSIAATSYLETDQLFITIEDEYARTQAWGTCVALYDLMSKMQAETSPAYSKQMSDLSNGAKIALYIDYFLGIDVDADSAEISARIKMANVLMDGIPETQLTAMLADGERLQHNEEWLSLVVGTLKLCMKNLETQQNLINVWREMYASGAFE